MDLARYFRRLTQRLHKRNKSSSERDEFLQITLVPLFIMFVSLVIAYFLNLIKYNELLNLIMTAVIAEFAIVQGQSAWREMGSKEKRNKIEDLRNELEKAYGKLYSILSKESIISTNETEQLKQIMTTYPFMFPKDIFDIWQTIQDLQDQDDYYNRYLKSTTVDPKEEESINKIRDDRNRKMKEFKKRIIDEYNRKVKEYQDLVGRKQEDGSGYKPTSEATRESGASSADSKKFELSFRLVKASFVIAFIILVTAFSSDFVVRMLYSTSDFNLKVLAGFGAIGTIFGLFLLILATMPNVRRAILHMFGMD